MKRFWFLLIGLLVCAACGGGPVARPQIAVVKSVLSCSPADRAYASVLADRVGRWLTKGGVRYSVVEDGSLKRALAGRRLAFLVVCQKPSAEVLGVLANFRAKGGRIAVLQSYSPKLAKLMGVKIPVVPVGRAGPASVLSVVGGWWLTNAFTADEEEDVKARRVLEITCQAVPGVWNAAQWDARQRARQAGDRAYGRKQAPRAGEIHAVWDQTGQGLYPGDWPRTFGVLRSAGVTDLFVAVGGAGFAHYPSRILPRSGICLASGDQLAACLKAAQGTGIRVHAWFMCFSAARGSPERLASLGRRGWRTKNKSGQLTEYLNPANPDVRWHLLTALDEIVRQYAVAGVHLDFVRWYEKAGGKPNRPEVAIGTFVESVRRRTRAIRPRLILSAATFPSYPSCVASVGQDWKSWIDRGFVDYVVPMNYVEDPARYASLVADQSTHARQVVSGIGVTANESVLTPRQVIDQTLVARRMGLAGVALFDLDQTLATRVLPILRLGLFRGGQ